MTRHNSYIGRPATPLQSFFTNLDDEKSDSETSEESKSIVSEEKNDIPELEEEKHFDIQPYNLNITMPDFSIPRASHPHINYFNLYELRSTRIIIYGEDYTGIGEVFRDNYPFFTSGYEQEPREYPTSSDRPAIATPITFDQDPLEYDLWMIVVPFLSIRTQLQLRLTNHFFHNLPYAENEEQRFINYNAEFNYQIFLRALPVPTVITYPQENRYMHLLTALSSMARDTLSWMAARPSATSLYLYPDLYPEDEPERYVRNPVSTQRSIFEPLERRDFRNSLYRNNFFRAPAPAPTPAPLYNDVPEGQGFTMR